MSSININHFLQRMRLRETSSACCLFVNLIFIVGSVYKSHSSVPTDRSVRARCVNFPWYEIKKKRKKKEEINWVPHPRSVSSRVWRTYTRYNSVELPTTSTTRSSTCEKHRLPVCSIFPGLKWKEPTLKVLGSYSAREVMCTPPRIYHVVWWIIGVHGTLSQ